MVDFEILAEGGDGLGEEIKERMADAVKSDSIEGFHVSSDSYSFIQMPSKQLYHICAAANLR